MIETRTKREPPIAYQVRLSTVGGLNRFGEPMFRLVWGWNRMVQRGGLWSDPIRGEVSEYRWFPKYGEDKGNRWILETWMPPESFGSPWRWEVEMLDEKSGLLIDGPYPSRGDYECVAILEEPKQDILYNSSGQRYVNFQPMELSMSLLENIVAALRQDQSKSLAERRKKITAREEAKDKAWESRADAVLDNAMPSKFGLQPTSYAGQRKRSGRKNMPINRVVKESEVRPGGRQV
jgi:hypothetical protein